MGPAEAKIDHKEQRYQLHYEETTIENRYGLHHEAPEEHPVEPRLKGNEAEIDDNQRQEYGDIFVTLWAHEDQKLRPIRDENLNRDQIENYSAQEIEVIRVGEFIRQRANPAQEIDVTGGEAQTFRVFGEVQTIDQPLSGHQSSRITQELFW